MVSYMEYPGELVVAGRLDNLIRDKLLFGEHALYGTVYEDCMGLRAVKYSVIHKPGLHFGSFCSYEDDPQSRHLALASLAEDFCHGLELKGLRLSIESTRNMEDCLVRKVGPGSEFMSSRDRVIQKMDLSGLVTSNQFIPGGSEREIFYGNDCNRVRRII